MPVFLNSRAETVKLLGHVHTGASQCLFVYFSLNARINQNLLGRIGWLDRIRIWMIDHDGFFIWLLLATVMGNVKMRLRLNSTCGTRL